jgi:tRNA dimethylallyltransferase
MISDKKTKIVVIVGPTASGKSALAVAVAKKYDGEIISADSRQIYKKLDIGTAKVTEEEKEGVPHHLIDIVDIATVYSAIDFKNDAQKVISGIIARGKIPIVAGGTFFYIDALLGKVSVPEVLPNQELRGKLESVKTDALYTALLKLDPYRASTIDPKNKRRLIRALEIIEALGGVPKPQNTKTPYESLILGIKTEKNELRVRLRKRGEQWLKGGFIEETKSLLAEGISRDRLGEIGFEYTLGLEYIDGLLSEAEFVQKFEEKNWQYAKRQLVWLKRDQNIKWFSYDDTELIFDEISSFLNN